MGVSGLNGKAGLVVRRPQAHQYGADRIGKRYAMSLSSCDNLRIVLSSDAGRSNLGMAAMMVEVEVVSVASVAIVVIVVIVAIGLLVLALLLVRECGPDVRQRCAGAGMQEEAAN